MKNLVVGRSFVEDFRVYKPSTTENDGCCVGECYFLRTKFWKLFVICGLRWTDLSWRSRGFTFSTILRGRPEKMIEFVKSLGVEFKEEVSESGWCYYINISSKKKNLELIDKLYAKFYREYNTEMKKVA